MALEAHFKKRKEITAQMSLAPSGGGGNVPFATDETLKFVGGVLSVNVTDQVEEGNNLPVSSAAVQAAIDPAVDAALEEAKKSGVFDGSPGKTAYQYAQEGGFAGTEEEFAEKIAKEHPKKISELENDSKFITASGAPVQSVNGKTGAVTLNADDVGARPENWMPTATDVGARPENWMPTAAEVGALPDTYTPPNQTAEQVGADPSGTAAGKVSAHNTNTGAHSDIRLLISALASRLDALANSDDTTLDQMAEVVKYIKDNRELIEQITTGKVSVTDIVNNLTTNVSNMPLSAAQGVALKALVDGLSSGKLDANKLTEAINTALAQAKASGEFDGKNGTSVTVTSVTESAESGGNNIVKFSDGKTLTIKNGSDGVDGLDATPVTPLFANSIAECTDTTKLYVLPDGYIWAYMMTEVTEEVIAYTNQLPLSTDSSGNLYNGGKGWKTNTRLSSSGAESTSSATNMECIGFIPFKRGDVIRFSGITMNKNSANKNGSYFIQYDSNKAMIAQWVVSAFNTAIDRGWVRVDDNYNILQINTGDFPLDNQYTISENAAFFRISADEINADSIITINEEIKPTTVTTKKEGWANTGHAFVPADYEDRIIAVEEANAENEERIDAHETRIANLENRSVDGVPDYVISEAEEVIDKVVAAQGSRTFTFAAITDMHYGNASYTDGMVHACQAMQYIDSRIKLDAVSVLGDYTDGFTGTGYDNAIGDFKAINAELNGLRFAPNLRVHGNHDHYEIHSPILYRYIAAYSDDVVWGSKLGGYFYRDFEDFKLRIICLNTAEENDDGLSCSAEQYNWFAGVLDLSGKEDMADWQTLILSHHPLDWFVSNNSGYVFWQILKAYLDGTSWNGFTFAGKNSAKLVGNIHGHIHNFLYRNIAAGQPNITEDTLDVVRIATPEACYGRPNSYNGSWDYNPFGEDTSYPKTKGTAEDTAFCIYCIDLDSRTIKAICYGAGYDREFSY